MRSRARREGNSVPPARPDAGADRAPADETGCPRRRQRAAPALRQARQKWSAKPHAAPQSGPALAAKLPRPVHLSNAGPRARDTPCSLLPSAPKRTSVAAQTTAAAAGLAPHAQSAAARPALRPSGDRPDQPAPDAQTDPLPSSPYLTLAGCASPRARLVVSARPG